MLEKVLNRVYYTVISFQNTTPICSKPFDIGDFVIVNFGGGMRGKMIGTVTNPDLSRYIEVEANESWIDGDSGTVYRAGRRFLCHANEVSLTEQCVGKYKCLTKF